MESYERSAKDLSVMVSAGIEPESAGSFSIEDIEGYLRRERYENMREQGFDVPEEYHQKSVSRPYHKYCKVFKEPEATQYERDLKYREMLLGKLEQERTDEPIQTAPSRYEIMNDDEDLVFDWIAHEWIPDWMYAKREKAYELEEQIRKHYEGRQAALSATYIS